MADKMIINARRQLGWRRRTLSDVATVVLWVGWIYLWLPAFRKLNEVIRLKLSFETGAIEVLQTVDPISIRHSLVALLGTCALLLLWTLLPNRKVTKAHSVATLEDCARYFLLTVDEVAAGRNGRISVVHHDDEGGIVSVETKG